MSTPINLLVLAGSARTGSLNRQLASAVARMGRANGATVSQIELSDFALPIYNADLEAAQGLPLPALQLKKIFLDHQACIVCTPEYLGGCPPVLSNLLDWVSRPVPSHPEWRDGLRPFAGKVVGLLSASASPFGGVRGQSQLLPLFSALGCWVAPQRYALGQADQAFDPDGQLGNEVQRAGVRAVVDQVLWAARRLHAAP